MYLSVVYNILLCVAYNVCNHISQAETDLQASKSITKCRNGSFIYTRLVADDKVLMNHITSVNNYILGEDSRPCYFCSCGSADMPNQCIAVKSYLCMYYAKIHKMTYSGQNDKKLSGIYNQLWKEMENIVVDYMTQSGDDLENLSCIPLLSSYTDCNIDNICSGCNRCTCNVHGTWTCSQIQFCSKSEKPTEELERAMITTLQHIDPEHQSTSIKPQYKLTPDFHEKLDSSKDWVSVIVQKFAKPLDENAAGQLVEPAYQNRKVLEYGDPIIQNLTDIIKSKRAELQVYESLRNDFRRDFKFSDENVEKRKINQTEHSSEEYIKITDAPDTSDLFKKISKLKTDVRNVIFDIEDIKNEAKTKNVGHIINSDIENLVAAMKKYTFRRQQHRNTRRRENIKNYKNISKKSPYEMVKYAELFDTVINDIDSLQTDPQIRRMYVKNEVDFDLTKTIDKLSLAIDESEKIVKFSDETDFKMIFLKLQQLEVLHLTNLLNELSDNIENDKSNNTKPKLLEHVNKTLGLTEDIFEVKEINLKMINDSSSRRNLQPTEASSRFKKYLLEQIVKVKKFKKHVITKKELLNVLINNRLNKGSIKQRSKRNLRDVFDNLVTSITKFTPRVLQERMHIGKEMERKEDKKTG